MLPNVAARNDYSKLNALIRGRIATSTKTTVSSYTEIVDCEEEAVACHTATFFLILCLLAPFNCSWVSLAGRDAVTASLMSHLRTEDSHCSSYISAYGVSIAQYQRIESNWKSFQSICRAPSSASIDFVVIFTHDTDYYKDALPGPVHIDSSGFSDWSAIVTLDHTRPAEKYKREYVWIFRFKRGSFAPGHFPTNAKSDHLAVESGAHNSDRVADAAFTFVASQKD